MEGIFWLLGKLRRSGLADLLNLNRAKPKWEEKSELIPGNPREWLEVGSGLNSWDKTVRFLSMMPPESQ